MISKLLIQVANQKSPLVLFFTAVNALSASYITFIFLWTLANTLTTLSCHGWILAFIVSILWLEVPIGLTPLLMAKDL